MRQQPLIIGAGPAGCAAAIRLCLAGVRPLMLERTTGPADKVCGDFLSADTIGLAHDLGVVPLALGAVPIEQVRLVHRGRPADVRLPFAALGVSRRQLDAALLARAVALGAELRDGVTVRSLVRDGAGWAVEAGGSRFSAGTVFLATGKHDVRAWPRVRRDAGRESGAIGLKMYYRAAGAAGPSAPGTIELILFRGGYAGLLPVEGGRMVLCLAVRPDSFKAAGGWDGLLRLLTRGAPWLAGFLAGAEPLLPRPLAVAGVPYGFRARTTQEGVFRLGDQAAVIPSLTGDGMAIALSSGIAAADAWMAGVSAPVLQARQGRRLGTQMGVATLLHHAALHGRVQPILMAGARAAPNLVRRLARRTRLPDGTL